MSIAIVVPRVSVALLDYEDGELDIGHTPQAGGLSYRGTRYELRLRLAAQIRLFRPDLLITFNPCVTWLTNPSSQTSLALLFALISGCYATESSTSVAFNIFAALSQLIISVPNFGEYQRGSQHKDHQLVGQQSLDCFYPLARDHLQFDELWHR